MTKVHAPAVGRVTLLFEEWEAKYKPKYVHPRGLLGADTGDSAPEGGFMFETYGEEYEKVQQAYAKNPRLIWTVYDDGSVSSGFHVVNRLGYFICAVPFEEGREFEVVEEGNRPCDNMHGLYCPGCKRSDTLRVQVSGMALLTAGAGGDIEHLDWTPESAAECAECGWSGKAAELERRCA